MTRFVRLAAGGRAAGRDGEADGHGGEARRAAAGPPRAPRPGARPVHGSSSSSNPLNSIRYRRIISAGLAI
jgi:hypothetical protein